MMDKIKVLIDKYGLPESVAFEVEKKLLIADLYKLPLSTNYPKQDNPKVVELICKAEPKKKITLTGEPGWRTVTKHHEDGTPYKSISEQQGKLIEFVPQITRVQFLINGDRHTIDDPNLIESIRQHLAKNELKCIPKRPANAPKKISNKVLRDLIKKLLQYSNEKNDYGKHVFAGKVLSVFLTDWQKQDNQTLQDTIRNLLGKKVTD